MIIILDKCRLQSACNSHSNVTRCTHRVGGEQQVNGGLLFAPWRVEPIPIVLPSPCRGVEAPRWRRSRVPGAVRPKSSTRVDQLGQRSAQISAHELFHPDADRRRSRGPRSRGRGRTNGAAGGPSPRPGGTDGRQTADTSVIQRAFSAGTLGDRFLLIRLLMHVGSLISFF